MAAPPTVPTGPSAMQYNNIPGSGAPTGPSSARKRNFDDRGDAEALLGRIADDINGRGFKQPRMERNAAPGGQYDSFGNYIPPAAQHMSPMQQQLPQVPQMPAGMPQFDPNDPVAMMAAMQAMGFQIPGMPGFEANGPPSGPPAINGRVSAPQTNNRRCRDYDTKGFCARGNSCKFEHNDSVFIPQGNSDEYDPTSLSLLLGANNPPAPSFESRHHAPKNFNPSQYPGSNERGRGRGRGQFNDRGGPNGASSRRGGRSEFSSDRPNYDRTKTKIVVENIPEDKFDESNIRAFFSEFGNITELTTQAYRKLAVITFSTHEEAQTAYSSPKVIFDNRFVKVFWYKDDESLPQPPPSRSQLHSRHGSGDIIMKAPEIDMEEFAKKQAEAQAAHEEKEKKKAEVEKQREDMQKRAEELLAKQAEEKKKLMERLAAMEKKAAASAGTGEQPKSEAQLLREKMMALEAETKRLSEAKNHAEEQEAWPARGRGRGGYRGRGAYTPHFPSPATDEKPSNQAEALKQQLAALEAEAAQLGIDPNTQEDQVGAWPTRGRGRGGFRGRGTFPPRGRGAFRGRGGAAFGSGANAYKLDNRPKTVAVSGVDFADSSKDEALRQFLLVSSLFQRSKRRMLTLDQGVGEFASIDNKGDKTEITFNDRFTAEKFMYGMPNNELPGVGKVEMAWTQKPLPPVTLSALTSENDTSSPAKDSEMSMGDGTNAHDYGNRNNGGIQAEHDRERDLDYDDGDNDWAQ